MDEFDNRLRSRLVALAESAKASETGQSDVVRSHHRTRNEFPIGVLTLAVVVAGVILLIRPGVESGPAAPVGSSSLMQTLAATTEPSLRSTAAASASQAPTVALASPLPPGGVSKADAVRLAGDHTHFFTIVSAEAGAFRDLNRDPNIGPGYPIRPDRWVWAVTYLGNVTICSPVGVCYSPRPEMLTIYLDYFTGEFLATDGVSAAP
jgi:hypothetical protein